MLYPVDSDELAFSGNTGKAAGSRFKKMSPEVDQNDIVLVLELRWY